MRERTRELGMERRSQGWREGAGMERWRESAGDGEMARESAGDGEMERECAGDGEGERAGDSVQERGECKRWRQRARQRQEGEKTLWGELGGGGV